MPNPLDFLNPVNTAVETGKSLVDVFASLQDRRERENTSMAADLQELISELRRTHATIVKLVSPLRRIPEDPAVFAGEFRQVYYDFRDAYDAYDFGDERTHCHKLRRIQQRMLNRKPRFGSTRDWDALYTSLQALSNSDLDLIDQQYKPFMAWFDSVMQAIQALVESNDIPQAMAARRDFLSQLGPEYDRNKAVLDQMNDLVGTLTAEL
ncbi:MAG: hypothetical protein ACOY0R_08265 [Chloroflexota bacterium]